MCYSFWMQDPSYPHENNSNQRQNLAYSFKNLTKTLKDNDVHSSPLFNRNKETQERIIAVACLLTTADLLQQLILGMYGTAVVSVKRMLGAPVLAREQCWPSINTAAWKCVLWSVFKFYGAKLEQANVVSLSCVCVRAPLIIFCLQQQVSPRTKMF